MVDNLYKKRQNWQILADAGMEWQHIYLNHNLMIDIIWNRQMPTNAAHSLNYRCQMDFQRFVNSLASFYINSFNAWKNLASFGVPQKVFSLPVESPSFSLQSGSYLWKLLFWDFNSVTLLRPASSDSKLQNPLWHPSTNVVEVLYLLNTQLIYPDQSKGKKNPTRSPI